MLRRSTALLLPLLATFVIGCRGREEGDDEVGETATETTAGESSESDSSSSESTDTTTTDTTESTDTTDTTDTTDSTDTTDTGGVDEGQACGVLLACMDLCPDDEPSCEAICLEAASMAAVDEYDAIVQCVIDNACQDEACIDANCGAQIYTCFTGDLTCGELLGCSEGCAGEETCQTSCYYDSTALAQSQGQALQTCIADNQCVDDLCIVENCNPELQSCAGGMSDTLPCPLVADCVLQCGADVLCAEQCQISANPAAQAEVPPLIECASQEGCTDFDCTQQACPDEWGACVSGELDCAELAGCIDGCGGAPLCEYMCVTEGSFMGQVLIGALTQCISDNQCVDDPCIADNCGVQLMACGI